ncbi:hypothetical protein AB4212_05530 [Streptomyces sp. 2MCAF27]
MALIPISNHGKGAETAEQRRPRVDLLRMGQDMLQFVFAGEVVVGQIEVGIGAVEDDDRETVARLGAREQGVQLTRHRCVD